MVLLAGCGHATDTPASRPTASPTATPAAAIAIESPDAGSVVRAGRAVVVSGTAAPQATVLLSAGCAQAGCSAIARAGDDGRWHARLRPRDARTTIEASTPSGDRVDRLRVRVKAPPAAPLPPASSEAEPTATARPRPTRVVVVGDSLTVGIKDILPGLLPGYAVSIDARNGRPLAEGMQIIARDDVRGAVLAVGLFTNDDPRTVDTLEQAVRSTVNAVGDGGCAVWATIVRPPQSGVSYAAANARLAALEAELSPHLILVPWAQAVAARPGLVGPDGVHGVGDGYKVRASLYAEAIRSCGG